MKTLIITDVQNDFMPNGALPVAFGHTIIPIINESMKHFDLIVATQDWHPLNHMSFADNHPGRNAFDVIQIGQYEQTLWPVHCVQGSKGAEFHERLNTDPIEAIFRKGTDPNLDSYSGFYDNYHLKSTGLAGYLREKGANELYFSGLCADICVYFSIQDALTEGFTCVLLENATCALDVAKFGKIKAEFYTKGVRILQSSDLRT